MATDQSEIADGTLVVRSREDDGKHVIALAGELDLANAGTAEKTLEEAFANDPGAIVVDMRELEFIDSTGIALIVSTLSRDSGRGRVSFVPSDSATVTRVMDLTGLTERLPRAEA